MGVHNYYASTLFGFLAHELDNLDKIFCYINEKMMPWKPTLQKNFKLLSHTCNGVISWKCIVFDWFVRSFRIASITSFMALNFCLLI